MTQPFTREDMVDAIATAISDSLDATWNSHVGAEAVVRNCGVFELYEAASEALLRCSMSNSMRGQLNAALTKVRGEPQP